MLTTPFTPRSALSPGSLLVAASSVALAASFLDLATSAQALTDDLSSLRSAAAAVAVTTAITFCVVLAAAVVARLVLRRLARRLVLPVAVAVTVLVLGFARFASPDNTYLSYYDCAPDVLVCTPYAERLSAVLLAVAA